MSCGIDRILINVGAGEKCSKDMINIDIKQYGKINIICDITKNIPFDKESVDLIYSSSVLEHFSKYEWRDVLKYWYDLLKCDGEIEISTMDFEAICEQYLKEKNIESLIGLINGGSKENFYYDRHGNMYDYETLRKALEEIGFINVRRCHWSEFYPYKMDKNFDDYSRSYIPHMNFEKGKLMTLNVKAKKGKK